MYSKEKMLSELSFDLGMEDMESLVQKIISIYGDMTLGKFLRICPDEFITHQGIGAGKAKKLIVLQANTQNKIQNIKVSKPVWSRFGINWFNLDLKSAGTIKRTLIKAINATESPLEPALEPNMYQVNLALPVLAKKLNRKSESEAYVFCRNLVDDFQDIEPIKVKSLDPKSNFVKFKEPAKKLGELDLAIKYSIERALDLMPHNISLMSRYRFSIGRSRKTLREISEMPEFDVSHERVRQLTNKFVRHLQSSPIRKELFEMSLEDFKALMISNKTDSLADAFPESSSLFSNEVEFVELISLLAGIEAKKMKGIWDIDVTRALITGIFFDGLGPYDLSEYKEKLKEACSNRFKDESDYMILIEKAKEKGLIKVSKGKVYPAMLPAYVAAYNIIQAHPEGIHHTEVVSKMEEMGISKFEDGWADKVRPPGFIGFLVEQGKISVCGLGFYRTNKNFTPEDSEIKEILSQVYKLMRSSDEQGFRLRSDIYNNMKSRDKYDYYLVRFIVKEFGSRRGIYFEGGSQLDTLSFHEWVPTKSQKDVIYQEICKKAPEPVHPNELVDLISSKSKAHAAGYLHSLKHEGLVVMKSNGAYTTPEAAFDGVDIEKALLFTDKKLSLKQSSVSILLIARQMGICSSAAWSLIKIYGDDLEQPVFLKKGYVSRVDMPYRGIRDIAREAFSKSDLDNEKFVALMDEKVVMSRSENTELFNWLKR